MNFGKHLSNKQKLKLTWIGKAHGLEGDRKHFKKVLDDFLAFYSFNRAELPATDA